jgi:RNA polymerase sigma factor (sigma-70 family)
VKVATQSDAELLTNAREGDEAAYTELYVRHHAAAQRLAQGYRRLGDPDDLVNGAFERVLAALRRGSGPTESFRAYLFVTLRRLAMEQARYADDESLDEVPEPVAAVVGDPELAGTEREIITQAFESLPGPWQTVLWQTAVEGKQPKDFAGTMGMTPNAAAALAYRARERLRQAYLQAHLQEGDYSSCEPHRSRLGGYVRGGLSWRQERATRDHLAQCESCAALVAELSDVNRMLVRTVAPLFLLASGGASLAGELAPGAGLASVSGITGGAATGAGTAGSSLAGGLATGAADGGRRFGAIAGALVAAAATVVALSVTLLPHDAGPAGGGPEVDVQTDAGPGTDDDAVRSTTTSSTPPTTALRGPTTTAAAAPTTTVAPAPDDAAEPSAPTSSDSPTTTAPTTSVGAGVDVGVDVGVGSGTVQAQAQVDLRLDAAWVSNVLGGTLNVTVANRGSATAGSVTVDVTLGANAGLSGPVMGCQTTPSGIVSGVISMLREVTCPLLAITGGGSTQVGFPVMLTLDSTATVTLRNDGQVVATRTVNLS